MDISENMEIDDCMECDTEDDVSAQSAQGQCSLLSPNSDLKDVPNQNPGNANAKESWRSALDKKKLTIEDVAKDLILPFLPAKSLCRFKSVCKEWNQWINSPFFVHRQSYSFKTTSGFFYQPLNQFPIFISMNPHAYGVASPSITFLPERVNVRTSCNGLICVGNDNNYYICNPVNKQGLVLPKPNLYHGLGSALVLAYEPSLLNFVENYELICAIPSIGAVRFEIFSSRSRTWRVVDSICTDLNYPKLCGDGFYMNGFAYWETSSGEVLAFDLKYELFSVFPLPPNRGPAGVLTKCHGELCYILPYQKEDEVCLLEVYGDMDMSLKHAISFRVENLEIVEGDLDEEGDIGVRSLPCLGDDTFAIIVGRNVIAYDERANRVQMLKVLSKSCDHGKFVPYVNSLVPVRHHQMFSEISDVTNGRR